MGEERCGLIVSLKSTSDLTELMSKVENEIGAVQVGTWRVEIAYYRFRPSESLFSEAYVVGCATGQERPTWVTLAGRRGSELFEGCAMGSDVCALLLENVKPRATATIQGKCFEVDDFYARIGTFKQGSTSRAAIVAIRYRALRPSHPAAAEAERVFLEDALGVPADAYTAYPALPLNLPRHDQPPSYYDLGHHLSLVNCFRTTVYGSSVGAATPSAARQQNSASG